MLSASDHSISFCFVLNRQGKIDFHDFHSYSFEGEFDTVAAFVVSRSCT